MDPQQYASLEPLDSDHLMEKVAEFQREIDAEQATLDDHKAAAKISKAKIERWAEKLAVIGRSRDNGQPVYQLRGGELTTDKPTVDGTLGFDKVQDTKPEEPTPEPVEEVEPEPAVEELPEQQDGVDPEPEWYAASDTITNTPITIEKGKGGKWQVYTGAEARLARAFPGTATAQEQVDKVSAHYGGKLVWECGNYEAAEPAPAELDEEGIAEGVEPVEEPTEEPADLTAGL